ncbi:MAG: hypothetical protein K8T10_06015 [Candidatus Eremiobacteraeota bacterium]|nr:hypothetical protein [Candidatus Eremiobacteraeota bacterium]
MIIDFLRQHNEWACPALAAISGVIFSVAYLKMKYGQRFNYARYSWASFLFIILSSLLGAFVYLYIRENSFLISQNTSKNLSAGVMKEYAFAIICGATLTVSGIIGIIIGIKKPGTHGKEILDIMTLLIQPIEDHITAQINIRELRLFNNCMYFREVPINILSIAVEKIIVSKIDEKDSEKLLQYGIKIEKHRASENRLAFISMLFEFYPPEGISNEFNDFCKGLHNSQNSNKKESQEIPVLPPQTAIEPLESDIN